MSRIPGIDFSEDSFGGLYLGAGLLLGRCVLLLHDPVDHSHCRFELVQVGSVRIEGFRNLRRCDLLRPHPLPVAPRQILQNRAVMRQPR